MRKIDHDNHNHNHNYDNNHRDYLLSIFNDRVSRINWGDMDTKTLENVLIALGLYTVTDNEEKT